MKIFSVFFLLLFFAVNVCPAEKIAIKGSNTEATNGPSDDFVNGDFEKVTENEKQFSSLEPPLSKKGELKGLEREVLDFFKRSESLLPWTTHGDVSPVDQGGNKLAELRSKDKYGGAFLAQNIAFKNKNASVDFDLIVIAAKTTDVLEVLAFDGAAEILLASFALSNFSSQLRHLSIKLTDNTKFTSSYGKNSFTVAFRLKGSGETPSIIRLDNIKIVY